MNELHGPAIFFLSSCSRASFGERLTPRHAIKASPLPTLFIIGDNGWLDCDNIDESYGYWQKHLFDYHERADLNWRPLGANVGRNADFPEFFAFKLDGILFLGRALPSTQNFYNKFTYRQFEKYLKTNADATRAQIAANAGKIRAVVIFGHNVSKIL